MRRSLFSSLALLAVLIMCLPVVATGSTNPADAQTSLQTSVSRILGFIQSPGYANPATRQSLNASIEKEVYAIFDFDEFSMRTVGAFWKQFSPKQKQDFTKAFSDLLFATYLGRIEGYNGEKVLYDGFVSGNNGKRVEVRTVINLKGNTKIPLNYRMLPKNGKWVVYDVLVEGVSLVKNYRTQFNDALQSGSPEALIARVKERAAAMKSASHAK